MEINFTVKRNNQNSPNIYLNTILNDEDVSIPVDINSIISIIPLDVLIEYLEDLKIRFQEIILNNEKVFFGSQTAELSFIQSYLESNGSI